MTVMDLKTKRAQLVKQLREAERDVECAARSLSASYDAYRRSITGDSAIDRTIQRESDALAEAARRRDELHARLDELDPGIWREPGGDFSKPRPAGGHRKGALPLRIETRRKSGGNHQKSRSTA